MGSFKKTLKYTFILKLAPITLTAKKCFILAYFASMFKTTTILYTIIRNQSLKNDFKISFFAHNTYYKKINYTTIKKNLLLIKEN